MNKKNIYSNISEEENKIVESLNEDRTARMVKPFILKDVKYNLSLCFIAWSLGYFVWSAEGEPSSLLVGTIYIFTLVPVFYFLYDILYVSSAKNPKNLSISYFLMKKFNKNKLQEFNHKNKLDIA